VTVATLIVPADDPAPLEAVRLLLDAAVREVGYERSERIEPDRRHGRCSL
jgi:hypothetical protein